MLREGILYFLGFKRVRNRNVFSIRFNEDVVEMSWIIIGEVVDFLV